MKIGMKIETTKVVADAEEKLAIDAEGLMVARFLEALKELREAAPRGDIHIHLYVKGEITKS